MKEFIDCLRISPEVVSSLKSMPTTSGGSIFEDLANLFMEEAPAQLEALKSAVDRRDFYLIESAAHSLKSTFGSIGFEILHNECRLLEDAARKKLSLDYRSRLEILDALVEESIEVVRKELSQTKKP